jgi:hypothetical protein
MVTVATGAEQERRADDASAAGPRTSDLNLGAGHVVFRRTSFEGRRSPEAAPTSNELPQREMNPHTWDSNNPKVVCGMGMTWKPLGRVEPDSQGWLALPSPPAQPGIYCFRIRTGDEERRYIGETDNLARRFGNYRNPGAGQQTNIRINAILLEALHAGAEISVSVVSEDAWLTGGAEPVELSCR